MRIIAGKYKNREIRAPQGDATRPVLTRVRKAIFDSAAPVIEGGAVLDLFAGSGGFVIEALSRGAARAVAIDLDAAAVKAIRANLKHCGVSEPVDVFKNDAFDAIGKLGAKGAKFDLVAVAPPYWKQLQARALHALDEADVLAPGGLLFVQSDAHERTPRDEKLVRLRFLRRKEYGNTFVDWYANAADADAVAPDEREGEAADGSGGETEEGER